MTTPDPSGPSLSSERIRAEAAAWMARLRDEAQHATVDAEVQAWLAADPDHRRAFDRMTRAWEQAGRIRLRATASAHRAVRSAEPTWAPDLAHGPGPTQDSWSMRQSRRTQWPFAVQAAVFGCILAVAGGFLMTVRDPNAVVTEIGQRQLKFLPDGTRVVLNTDTRIEVNFDERARRVRLAHGEASFDVVKNSEWPFLVIVGDEEVRAVGTSFIVRRDDAQNLSVILVEGRVSVAPVGRSDEDPAVRGTQLLGPGQRITIRTNRAPTVDRPELNRLTAWKLGRVEFEQTPIAEAVKEMNRYSKVHLAVAGADLAHYRVGGVFRAGDSEEFVRIVSAAFGLRAERHGREILLCPAGGVPPP